MSIIIKVLVSKYNHSYKKRGKNIFLTILSAFTNLSVRRNF